VNYSVFFRFQQISLALLWRLAQRWFVAGFVVIYYNKLANNKPHFISWHGLLGVITIIYMVLQCSGGLNLLYPQTAVRFFRLVSLKQLHATSALLLFSLAVAALVTGMLSRWFVAAVTGTSWYMSVVCPVLTLTMLASQVNSAYFSLWRSPMPFKYCHISIIQH